MGRRRRSRRAGDHQHRDHARTADQRADPDRLAPCRGRPRVTKASATASCSSATRGRGRSCRRCRAAARRRRRSGSTPCPPPTRSTRCSTRSTSSRTPGECDHRTRPPTTTSTSRPNSSSRRGSWPRPSWPSTSAERNSRPGWSPPRASSSTARPTAVEQDVRPDAHFDNLAAIVEQQMELADRHDLRVAAVGVGCAGPITANCETVSPVTLSAWREFPLRERLRELTAKRVYGDLDGKALALAEGWMGAAKGYDNYCVITVSTVSAEASSSTASCSTGRRPTPATSATSSSTPTVGGAVRCSRLPRGGGFRVGDRGDHRAVADGADVRDHAAHRAARRPGGRVAVQPSRPRPGRRRRWRGPRVRRDLLQRGPGGAQHVRPAAVQPAGEDHPDPARRSSAVDRSRGGRDQGLVTGPQPHGTERSSGVDDEDPQHRRQSHPGPPRAGGRRHVDSRARVAAAFRSPAARPAAGA